MDQRKIVTELTFYLSQLFSHYRCRLFGEDVFRTENNFPRLSFLFTFSSIICLSFLMFSKDGSRKNHSSRKQCSSCPRGGDPFHWRIPQPSYFCFVSSFTGTAYYDAPSCIFLCSRLFVIVGDIFLLPISFFLSLITDGLTFSERPKLPFVHVSCVMMCSLQIIVPAETFRSHFTNSVILTPSLIRKTHQWDVFGDTICSNSGYSFVS